MWKEWWSSGSGRIIGVTAGIFFGFLYLFVGFWDMLFFALLVFIGYVVGKQKDTDSGPLLPWRRLSEWVMDRWRPFR
ncbi:DUF2273 domain-containing protein [Paenibacillus cisolokensis]|jgi:uncharacterized membrane protein|uniref:DUF2273 domain-containing protein n=1 Tax=Paenibacillus cisolokensis TaxID=1658519 RepID=A0ABQ4NCJ5_9BACL|nr:MULTISPECIES: DUF2273 domain-containing protein [Paenibacillus]ALS28401.1 small integral membrane protein [Paenibacillus sp. 32O-W]GIQ65905.1 hypothetical protein PACILC2_44730 [Paenibacillus cisolokensis]